MKYSKYILVVAFLALISLLALPMVIYVKIFGFGVWTSHKELGVMGSAIGGIYSAIFAFLTLLVLIGQSIFYLRSHKYMLDMEFIRDNKSDYNEQLKILSEALCNNSRAAESELLRIIESIPEEDLAKPEYFQIVRKYNSNHPHVISIWAALQPILNGLSHQKRFPYEHSFSGIKLKTASILSFRVCVSLDKALYSLGGIEQGKFYYWEPQT